MVKTNITWDPGDFADIAGIFNLFRTAGYIVGNASPASENSTIDIMGGQLGGNIKEIYKVTDEPFHIWVIVGIDAIRARNWRKAISNEISKSGGIHVLFFTTERSSTYHLVVVIHDKRAIEAVFRPKSPGQFARYILVNLLDRNLIDTLHPGGIFNKIEKYSLDLTGSDFLFIMCVVGGVCAIWLGFFGSIFLNDISYIIVIIIGLILLITGIMWLGGLFKHGGN